MTDKKRKAQSSTEGNISVPAVVTIAGSDCSGGAGIQADLKTFTTFGVYGASVVTCVVAEHPGRLMRTDSLPAASVKAQLAMVLEAFPLSAAKTGMLYSKEIIRAVATLLKRKKMKLVVDPVMISSSQSRLLKADAVKALSESLFPLASVITPNRDEAAILLGCSPKEIVDLSTLRQAGWDLHRKFKVPILIKGGHVGGLNAIDFLCVENQVKSYSSPFIKGVDPHGTGCTYSAAITASLAKGFSLEDAVDHGKKFITQAIANHLTIGKYAVLNQLPN